MLEFARRNAGVAAAVGAYGLLGTAGVLAIQQTGNRASPISAPPAVTPTPTAAPSSAPTATPSAPWPTSSASPAQSGSRVVAATGSSAGQGVGTQGGAGSGGGGAGSAKPSPPAQSPAPARCGGGRVVAVSVPLGAIPCDAVRVGRLAHVGGTG